VRRRSIAFWARLRRQTRPTRAERLYCHFNDAFWLPDDGFYAYGLDPAKQPIRTVASNPGQLC
jgi:glycogen debranching enzyme